MTLRVNSKNEKDKSVFNKLLLPRVAVPTMLTLGALCFGLTGVKLALEKSYRYATYCVFTSAVLDALDGYAARTLDAVTGFGAELDSLCDLVTFGSSTVLIVYLWSRDLETVVPGSLIFMVLLSYVCACAFRLARFNIGSNFKAPEPTIRTYPGDRTDKGFESVVTPSPSIFFAGVPAPIASSFMFLPIFLSYSSISKYYKNIDYGIVIIITSLVTCILTGSTIPTISTKYFLGKYKQKTYGGYWDAVMINYLIYIGSIPLGLYLSKHSDRAGKDS